MYVCMYVCTRTHAVRVADGELGADIPTIHLHTLLVRLLVLTTLNSLRSFDALLTCTRIVALYAYNESYYV